MRIRSLKLSHELLAATLARYSRSNSGIENILSQIDPKNEQKSIDKIFKFVDYGHASIGGLTSGIPIVMDNISMFLAYKIFEISSMADGQESSTRYITINKTKLPTAEELEIPSDLTSKWTNIMNRSFDIYEKECNNINFDNVTFPSTNPKVITRMKKNYILDRTRYYIPFATKTNMALIQSARMWAQTVCHLSSMPQLEAKMAADYIREELKKYTPRLIKHSYPEKSYIKQCKFELEKSLSLGLTKLSVEEQNVESHLTIMKEQNYQSIENALKYRTNRYGYCGLGIRSMIVSYKLNNIAIAELRDLNRHRTGFKYTPLIQTGFYTGTNYNTQLLLDQKELLQELMERGHQSYVYALLLGSQTNFTHTTQGDKFIYEMELRTGVGAHYRYADHCYDLLKKFYKLVPEAEKYVKKGTAEPE